MTSGRALLPRFSPAVVVFAVAVAARLIPVIRAGGFNGNCGYDAAVYYAGSSALLHGRMPYRDFVLLHPPGILLADAPFAELGRLTTDHTGFAAAAVAAIALGGVNAVLVMRIARRLGLDRPAVIVGGLVYALWFGSITAEYLPRLEPVGNLLVLTGALALLAARAERRDPWHRWLLPAAAGSAFGAALSVKLWWAVPLGVVLAWIVVVEHRYRTALVTLGGAVVAALIIDGPFLLVARSAMPTMVVADQLGRVANNPHDLRVLGYLSFGWTGVRSSIGIRIVAVAVAGSLLALLALRAWRVRAARAAVLVLGVQLVQIMVQPSWFTFYADFLTVALALNVAAGVHRVPRPVQAPKGRPRRAAAPVVVGLVASALLPPALSPTLIDPFPRRMLTAAVAGARCVQSDSPIGLVQTNTLTRDLEHGCALWVDVTGRLYGVDRPVGDPRRTSSYVRWQGDITRYLRSGEVTLLVRTPASIHIDQRSVARIEHDGAIAVTRPYGVYRTRSS